MMTFLSYVIESLEKFPTVAFGLEEIAAPVTPVESKPKITVDSLPARFLDFGKDDKSSTDAYFVKNEKNEWQPLTWKDLAQEIEKVGKALMVQNLQKGDRVAIIGKNDPSWVIAYLASQSIAGIPLGIHDSISSPKVKEMLKATEPKVVFVDDESDLNKVQENLSSVPSIQKVVLFKRRGNKGANGESILGWDDFCKNGESTPTEQFEEKLALVKEEDPAVIVFSHDPSFSSPKPALLTHKNLAQTSKKVADLFKLSGDDTHLSHIPLSKVDEQIASILVPSVARNKIYFAEQKEKAANNLKEIQPTFVVGTPKDWKKLYNGLSSKAPPSQIEKLSLPEKNQLLQDVGLLKAKTCVGSAPIPVPILDYFNSLGKPILEGYGKPENCGTISQNTPDALKIGSVGKAFPDTQIKIAEDGEILIKGDNLFSGYHNDPKTTEEKLKEGFLYSGDVGRLDNDGYLFVDGPKKENIVTTTGKKN